MGWANHGSNPSSDNKFFSSPKCPEQLWEPTSLLFDGYRGSFLGIRAQHLGHAVDHSLPSSAEVKKEWSYTTAPPIWLHSMDRDNSAFYPRKIIKYSEWLQFEQCLFPAQTKIFLLNTISRLALESIHLPTQLIVRALSWLFTHPYLGWRSVMCGILPQVPRYAFIL
jgi:hypothetical protein